MNRGRLMLRRNIMQWRSLSKGSVVHKKSMAQNQIAVATDTLRPRHRLRIRRFVVGKKSMIQYQIVLTIHQEHSVRTTNLRIWSLCQGLYLNTEYGLWTYGYGVCVGAFILKSHLKLIKVQATSCAVSQQAQAQVQTSLEALKIPQPEGEVKIFSPKIEKLVTDISQLNLLEVADLSDALKKRLNLPDTPVMAMGSFAPAGAAQVSAEDEEEAAPKKVQTSFTVKLVKFDDKQKVALIKEIKNLLEGMNLVQAKKFVESAPTIVKGDIGKDEAEKLKEALVKVGAVIEID
uniref:39S ribosomal protein L12, mitochondrial n=1 Tax=Timema monikensis TaxID=170555 RepID=A0A7R9HU74_9NEOP|nr:unnamed protein product [Timema monikensis]